MRANQVYFINNRIEGKALVPVKCIYALLSVLRRWFCIDFRCLVTVSQCFVAVPHSVVG